MAEDAPGVLGQVSAILGEHRISIRSVLQHEPAEDQEQTPGVPVIITTHRAQEGEVRAALAKVDALKVVRGRTVCIPIVDEHPEPL